MFGTYRIFFLYLPYFVWLVLPYLFLCLLIIFNFGPCVRVFTGLVGCMVAAFACCRRRPAPVALEEESGTPHQCPAVCDECPPLPTGVSLLLPVHCMADFLCTYFPLHALTNNSVVVYVLL